MVTAAFFNTGFFEALKDHLTLGKPLSNAEPKLITNPSVLKILTPSSDDKGKG